MNTDMMKMRGELRAAAQNCLRRKAAGQHGRIKLPVTIENDPGPVVPCNAGTLFEVDWLVDSHGRVHLQLVIDGIQFWSAST